MYNCKVQSLPPPFKPTPVQAPAGKPKLVALIAVMRKMLHVLNRLLADPNFVLAR
jgi:hypothetical protein